MVEMEEPMSLLQWMVLAGWLIAVWCIRELVILMRTIYAHCDEED